MYKNFDGSSSDKAKRTDTKQRWFSSEPVDCVSLTYDNKSLQMRKRLTQSLKNNYGHQMNRGLGLNIEHCILRLFETDFLCFIEGVYVLQRSVEEILWWVAIDHWQALSCLQITARCLWLLLNPLYILPGAPLVDEPVDLHQRLRGESPEDVGACGREQACHLGIAKRYHHNGESLH